MQFAYENDSEMDRERIGEVAEMDKIDKKDKMDTQQ